ncbi:SDR family NAD(P)-dependent oxidoreductase [Nocardia sp. NPDC057353]|uniref:SDR family NAD(P)-dependent oxidoreductase n=1 Tax=Nocardia sp. NPDC057353 TaxID=3346104 RepID=UPI00362E8653
MTETTPAESDVLAGKVAIVTGTSRGVGVGIAHELLRAGATVVGCSRRELPALPGADTVPGAGSRAFQWVCDQGDPDGIDRFVGRVVERFGKVDILVNNAGGTVPTPHAEAVPELVQRMQAAPRAADEFTRTALFHSFAVQMNLISPLWFAVRVYREMRTGAERGAIINISSGAGHPAGSPSLVSYGAAKAGLNHLTRSLAEEWGAHARVNCLALGPTMTDNFQQFVLPADDPDGRDYFAAVPLGRAGTPAEVGRTCVFLCSGQADYINGTTIEIDGGMLPGVLYDAGLKTITDLL